ncbi:MAG: hypothetical protein K2L73_00690, partial [Muribaculaceae bacterium]|nr:hypothetical protein [Muribaculaceae bacterium]
GSHSPLKVCSDKQKRHVKRPSLSTKIFVKLNHGLHYDRSHPNAVLCIEIAPYMTVNSLAMSLYYPVAETQPPVN